MIDLRNYRANDPDVQELINTCTDLLVANMNIREMAIEHVGKVNADLWVEQAKLLLDKTEVLPKTSDELIEFFDRLQRTVKLKAFL